MNMLSGKKMLIVVVLAALSSIVTLFTGQDASELACSLADKAVDGGCAAMSSPMVTTTAQLLVAWFTTWAATKGLMKFAREKKAGASMAEAGTVIGAVKDAIKEGLIPPVIIQPPAAAVPLPPAKLEQIKAANADVLKKPEV
jgi:hypothetical protein